MERAFYNTDLRDVRPPESDESDSMGIEALISRLKSALPEKLAVLAELLRT